MKNVVGMDDSAPTAIISCGEDSTGKPILNVRKSVGTGGEYSLENGLCKTNKNELQNEARLCSQARDNKKKKVKKV